jgi:hypothetical protein
MLNLISRGTGHVVDPATHGEQMRILGEHARKGIDRDPRKIRFVTWTLKYSACHWLKILGLGEHYCRAEFQAEVDAADRLEVTGVSNITRFSVNRRLASVRIEGREVALPEGADRVSFDKAGDNGSGSLPEAGAGWVFSKSGGRWRCDGRQENTLFPGKVPGLQGPIDDAFTSAFLCVRGTGTPWNPRVHRWALESLARFQYEWSRYMRGDLPVKNDTEILPEDIRDKNVILFGDPGSNSILAEALSRLPIRWSGSDFELGGETFSFGTHVPVFIARNPLSPGRYLVVNSGHSFREKEWASLNYLLFPRLGDCAVLKLEGSRNSVSAGPESPVSIGTLPTEAKRDVPVFSEEIVRSGYFDEHWKKVGWLFP